MAGQLIQRGERTWLVRVYLGRDSQTGSRRYHNHTVRGTKKDAQRYLNGVLREIDLGTFVEPSATTLNEYLNKWVEAVKTKVSEQTLRGYKYLLSNHIRPALGEHRLASIKPLDIQTLYAEMQAQELSANTVRHVHTVISAAFKQAIRWKMATYNPASLVDLPKLSHQEMQVMSPEEAAQFLKAAEGDSYGFIFTFAMGTGMRPSEYLGLQWKDVDLGKGTVTVQRTLQRREGGGWYFDKTKTARGRRSIPLPASILKSLTSHKRGQAEQRLKLGAGYDNHDLVFASATGGPLDLPHLRKRFQDILERAKLSPSIRLYDLRHTCATLLLSAGENPKIVSERLGHASIAITLDTYSHVLPHMQQSAADKLENILFG